MALMHEDYQVVLAGDYFADLIFTGLPSFPELGKEFFGTGFNMTPGGTFNTVLALHRIGVRVGWLCDFGTDIFSQFVKEICAKEGLDPHFFRFHNKDLRRITVSISFPQDRAFVSFIDGKFLPVTEVSPILEQYRPSYLMLPGISYGDEHMAMVAAAHRAGTRVYMDCQGNPEVGLPQSTLDEAMRAVDIISSNADEALLLTGRATVEAALESLSELAPMVILKLGEAGCIAKQGDNILRVPGVRVNVVDTTGAGDCFNAGVVYGLLNGFSLKRCLTYGIVCGGLSTTVSGSAGAPFFSEVEAEVSNIFSID